MTLRASTTINTRLLTFPHSFEEMRLRYERREPRMEDLQQIEELKKEEMVKVQQIKNRCE